ncbi:hypothetical protein BD410DRAFT_816364 [Rickenella mellea]|uniref:tRNA-splicing endonuclease subunit Sen15 domain-containing protein n=1 Tax=Rickenella mellea TaxID=50990 RepID=A0A4Y7PQY2_9AGAM|nr:hypothetical protein BD410DRAFT_816364 [Rickenella mellea]
MEQHRSFPALSEISAKHPKTRGCLFQTYNDLLLAQQWEDLQVIDLPSCSRGAFRGRKPSTETVFSVVPCAMTETLSPSWLASAFEDLGNPPELYLAITTEDSSIVYYKISRGIVKPPQ